MNEPQIYAYRRKGLDYFCTCSAGRYLELSQKPTLFETTIFYALPPDAAAIIAKLTQERDEWKERAESSPLSEEAVDILRSQLAGKDTDIVVKQGAIDMLNSMNDQLQAEIERLTAEIAARGEEIEQRKAIHDSHNRAETELRAKVEHTENNLMCEREEVERLTAEIDKWRKDEHALSGAYVRLREKLQAFDTPRAPTAEQVWAHTETKLDALISELAAANERIADQNRSAEIDRRTIESLRAKKFARFGTEDCWIYQGDGEDHLESLACPVVVRPEVLIYQEVLIAALTEDRDDWITCHAKVFRDLQDTKTLAGNKCIEVATLTTALGKAREVLMLPCDRWNKRQSEIVAETLAAIDATLGEKGGA